MAGEPEETPHFDGDITAEGASVGVAFIDDEVFKGADEAQPAAVFAEYGQVQHVRVGKDEAAVVANPAAILGGCVPVILGGVGSLEEAALGGVFCHAGGPVEKFSEGAQLVCAQGLGGGEVEGGGGGVFGQHGEDGELVAEGFAGGGAGGDDDVGSLPGEVRGGSLVGVELADSLVGEPVVGGGEDPAGPGGILGVAAGEIPYVGDGDAGGVGGAEEVDEQTAPIGLGRWCSRHGSIVKKPCDMGGGVWLLSAAVGRTVGF